MKLLFFLILTIPFLGFSQGFSPIWSWYVAKKKRLFFHNFGQKIIKTVFFPASTGSRTKTLQRGRSREWEDLKFFKEAQLPKKSSELASSKFEISRQKGAFSFQRLQKLSTRFIFWDKLLRLFFLQKYFFYFVGKSDKLLGRVCFI